MVPRKTGAPMRSILCLLDGAEIAIGAPTGEDENGERTGRTYLMFSSFLP